LDHLINFSFVFLVGFLGFLLFLKLGTPVPGFLGSLFAVSILNVAGYYPEFSIYIFSFLAQAAVGVMIGRQINCGFLFHLRHIAPSVMFASGGALLVSLVTGLSIYLLSDASLSTSVIAGAMGGIAEMTTFGMSMGADPMVILFMLLFRFIFAVISSYWVLRLISRLVPNKAASAAHPPAHSIPAHSINESGFRVRDYFLLPVVAIAGGMLFRVLGVPNGIMLGAMLSCGALAVCLRKTYQFEQSARHVVLIVLALVIARHITADVVAVLPRLIVPGLVSSIVALTGTVLLALALYKATDMDIVTCVLCTSPAGLSQIAFLSEEMGANPLTTSIFQACRLLSIIAFYPWLVIALL